jgi:hypothetical protein
MGWWSTKTNDCEIYSAPGQTSQNIFRSGPVTYDKTSTFRLSGKVDVMLQSRYKKRRVSLHSNKTSNLEGVHISYLDASKQHQNIAEVKCHWTDFITLAAN